VIDVAGGDLEKYKRSSHIALSASAHRVRRSALTAFILFSISWFGSTLSFRLPAALVGESVRAGCGFLEATRGIA
jgi:hypothetical protein